MKIKLLLAVLLPCIYLAAQSTVLPIENASFPGNTVTYFAQNPVSSFGGVIDNLPAQTISSIAFRPNFRHTMASTVVFPAQIVRIYLQMSSGPQDTWSMQGPNNIDVATMKEPLGPTGTNISFPQTKTMLPPIGLQAFLTEQFSIKIDLVTPYIHPGGNLQFYISWPLKTNSSPISAIDSQVIYNYMGTGSGYYTEGNQSFVYNLSIPFYCFVATAPLMVARGIQEQPNYVALMLSQSGYGPHAALITPNVIGQNIGWIGPGNVFCSVNFDIIGAMAIPYSSTTALQVPVTSALQGAYMASLVVVPNNGSFYTSNPEVITYPTIYPARNYGGRNPRVPTIRIMEDFSYVTDWIAAVVELK